MITVKFYGDLRQFGREFKLHAGTPAEALRGLLLQLQGLRKTFEAGQYKVKLGDKIVSSAEAEDSLRGGFSGDLHITPVVQGAGKFGQIIIGVVLIIVSFFVPVAWAAVGSMMMSMGVGLVIGGIAQLLTKTDTNLDSSSEKDSRNTSFSNLQNTAAQGQPVPLAYGRVRCGSRVISQGYSTRRLDTNTNAATDDPTVAVAAPITKTFYAPVATTAPDGSKYNIDLNDDSVRAANYTARVS